MVLGTLNNTSKFGKLNQTIWLKICNQAVLIIPSYDMKTKLWLASRWDVCEIGPANPGWIFWF